MLSPQLLRVDVPANTRLHSALLEAASMATTGLRSEDQTLWPLALSYVEGAMQAQTTLLDVGGLLIPANDVLDFAPASEDLAWDLLLRADCDLSPQCARDALVRRPPPAARNSPRLAAVAAQEMCCDLHALVGRRARSRPNLGARLGAAAGGGHLSEPPLPPAQAACVPSGGLASQRVADAACGFVASAFARADDAGRTRVLFGLMTRLKEPKEPARAAMNVMAGFLGGLRCVVGRWKRQRVAGS